MKGIRYPAFVTASVGTAGTAHVSEPMAMFRSRHGCNSGVDDRMQRRACAIAVRGRAP